MKKYFFSTLFFIALSTMSIRAQEASQFIARQGRVSFFSYTPVENIEAVNNQVFSLVDLSDGQIAVRMLMRAFVFKKALMQEHFNESYVESDLYPELKFSGQIQESLSLQESGTFLVKGTLFFHGVEKEVEVKILMEKNQESITLTGDLEVQIEDYKIKVPVLLAPNISKIIQVKFRFEYQPYE